MLLAVVYLPFPLPSPPTLENYPNVSSASAEKHHFNRNVYGTTKK
jgi:hypothetical protein